MNEPFLSASVLVQLHGASPVRRLEEKHEKVTQASQAKPIQDKIICYGMVGILQERLEENILHIPTTVCTLLPAKSRSWPVNLLETIRRSKFVKLSFRDKFAMKNDDWPRRNVCIRQGTGR